ncbi:MAG: hypothetical protein WB566_04325 [Terriglobales bacterium]
MSISGILSSSYNQNQLSGASFNWQQQIQQLSQDLTSGNLTAAQSDFASLQKAFAQPATTSGSATGSASSTTSSAAQAFSQLGSDLQSGNLSAAQKDISTVQQALQNSTGAGAGNRPHHHHHISAGGDGDSTSQNALLQEFSQVGQSLTAGNLSGAQQAYATLQQQLQQFALGGGALSTESPVSFDA